MNEGASGVRSSRAHRARRALISKSVPVWFVLASTAAVAPAWGGGPNGSSPAAADYTNRIIVQYRSDAMGAMAEARSVAAAADRYGAMTGVQLKPVRRMIDGAQIFSMNDWHHLSSARAIVARIAAEDPTVLYAEPDVRMFPLALPLPIEPRPVTPNDPRFIEQWDMHEAAGGIRMPQAWGYTRGSTNVTMAVLDTGIRPHADFGNRIVPGYDFVSSATTGNDGNGRDTDASDPGDWCGNTGKSSWHGTHVAGTMGATGDDGFGVAGINWRSKIMPVRVLGRCGGSMADIADAIRWSAGTDLPGGPAKPATPAKVMNLSLGGSGACSQTFQNAINAANALGAVIVVAAGNSNADAANFQPASCNNVIAVAATNRPGGKASYSNFGAKVKIAAPGGQTSGGQANGILSTLNSGTQAPAADSYAFYQGTSMAAPHVAGVVSLMFSVNATLTPAKVLEVLQATARAFPTGTGSDCTTARCGAGILDAAAAVKAVRRRVVEAEPMPLPHLPELPAALE